MHTICISTHDIITSYSKKKVTYFIRFSKFIVPNACVAVRQQMPFNCSFDDSFCGWTTHQSNVSAWQRLQSLDISDHTTGSRFVTKFYEVMGVKVFFVIPMFLLRYMYLYRTCSFACLCSADIKAQISIKCICFSFVRYKLLHSRFRSLNLLVGGRYVSTTAKISDNAPFLSPLIDLEYRPKCITFWHQLYSGHSVILKVYSVSDTARAILHEETIRNNGPVWTKAVVYTEMKEMFQVMHIHAFPQIFKLKCTIGKCAVFQALIFIFVAHIFGQMSSLNSCV